MLCACFLNRLLAVGTQRLVVADTQGFGAVGFERWQKALRGG